LLAASPAFAGEKTKVSKTTEVMSATSPGDGEELSVESVDAFDPAGGAVVIDPGTVDEETITYSSVDSGTSELVGIERSEAQPHDLGATVEPASVTASNGDLNGDEIIDEVTRFFLSPEITLGSDGTTVSTASLSGWRKRYGQAGNLLSTTSITSTSVGGTNSNFSCVYDRTKTGFSPLPIKDVSSTYPEFSYQFQFFPYRQRNARTINGVSQLQYLICGTGGIDAQNGHRTTISGPGMAFKSTTTTRKIGQIWKSGPTGPSTSVTLGFSAGTGSVNVSGSISQTQSAELKGSINPPYADTGMDSYARNAANAWYDNSCGFACPPTQGSAEFQGSVVEGLWEFPMPSSSTTYRFKLAAYGQVHCGNIFGC
jgi:hypothetical protein